MKSGHDSIRGNYGLWNGYAAAIASIAGTALSAHAAHNIAYFNPADVTANASPGPGQAIYFDLDGSGGTTLASNTYFSGADFSIYFFGVGPNKNPVVLGSDANRKAASDLPFSYDYKLNGGNPVGGDLISSALNFDQISYPWHNPNGHWTGKSRGFLGLEIVSGAQTYYGWAQLTYDRPAKTMTLLDFAIRTVANTPIEAGDTGLPEPRSLVLAALGATGLIALRKKRQATA